MAKPRCDCSEAMPSELSCDGAGVGWDETSAGRLQCTTNDVALDDGPMKLNDSPFHASHHIGLDVRDGEGRVVTVRAKDARAVHLLAEFVQCVAQLVDDRVVEAHELVLEPDPMRQLSARDTGSGSIRPGRVTAAGLLAYLDDEVHFDPQSKSYGLSTHSVRAITIFYI
jgi:hypothetical protein